MDVLAPVVTILRAVFGSLFSALILSPIVYVLQAILPTPDSLTGKFLSGIAYLLGIALIAHFAYAITYQPCPSLPNLPNWELDCPPPSIGDALFFALRATLLIAPYFLLFFAAAFFVYHRLALSSKFLRIYLSVLMFLVVMLLWVSVFPWSLDRYLQLYY